MSFLSLSPPAFGCKLKKNICIKNEEKKTNFHFAMRLPFFRYCIAWRPFVMVSSISLFIFFSFVLSPVGWIEFNYSKPTTWMYNAKFNSDNDISAAWWEMRERTLLAQLLWQPNVVYQFNLKQNQDTQCLVFQNIRPVFVISMSSLWSQKMDAFVSVELLNDLDHVIPWGLPSHSQR